MVAPCATPEGPTHRLLTVGHRPRSEKFAKFLNEKKGKADHQDLMANRSSSRIIQSRQFDRKTSYKDHMQIADGALEARESSSADKLQGRNGNGEQRFVRSIICAQDYYPTSFNQSSRTFSPVKLRKMHLSPETNKHSGARPCDQEQKEHNANKGDFGENHNEHKNRRLAKNKMDTAINSKSIRSLSEIESPSTMSMPQMKELMKEIDLKHRKTVIKQTSISAEILRKETKAAAKKFDLSTRLFHENKLEVFGLVQKSEMSSEVIQGNLATNPSNKSFYRKKTLNDQKLSSRSSFQNYKSSGSSSTKKQGDGQAVNQNNFTQSSQSRTQGTNQQKLGSKIRSIPAYAKHSSARSLLSRQKSLLPTRVIETSVKVNPLSPNNSRGSHDLKDEIRSSVKKSARTLSTNLTTSQPRKDDSEVEICTATEDKDMQKSSEQASVISEALGMEESGVAPFDSIMSFFTSLNSSRKISTEQTSSVVREDKNVMDFSALPVANENILEEVDAEDTNSLLDEVAISSIDKHDPDKNNVESIKLNPLLQDSEEKLGSVEDENVTDNPDLPRMKTDDVYEVLGINKNASDEVSEPEQNNDMKLDLSKDRRDDLIRPEVAHEILDIVRKASIRSIPDQADCLERIMKQKEDMNLALGEEEKVSTGRGHDHDREKDNERIVESKAENKIVEERETCGPKGNDLVMESKDLLSGSQSDNYSSFSQSQYSSSSGSIFDDESRSASNAGLSSVNSTEEEA